MLIRSRKHLTTKARSKLSERRTAALFKGRTQPASGAVKRHDLKGDVKSAQFVVEDKTTGARSYALSVETWRKISNEAWSQNRRPAMKIEFTDGPTLVVLEESTFAEMMEAFVTDNGR